MYSFALTIVKPWQVMKSLKKCLCRKRTRLPFVLYMDICAVFRDYWYGFVVICQFLWKLSVDGCLLCLHEFSMHGWYHHCGPYWADCSYTALCCESLFPCIFSTHQKYSLLCYSYNNTVFFDPVNVAHWTSCTVIIIVAVLLLLLASQRPSDDIATQTLNRCLGKLCIVSLPIVRLL